MAKQKIRLATDQMQVLEEALELYAKALELTTGHPDQAVTEMLALAPQVTRITVTIEN